MQKLTIIGHRGARGLAPENTIAALKKGMAAKADMLEIDVRVTLDGIPILSHGPFIHDEPVDRSTYKQLKEVEPDIATLKEALETAGHDCPLYIEVKPCVDTASITQILKSCLAKGWPAANLYLASFSQRTLLKLNESLPELPTIVIDSWSGVRARRHAKQLGTKTICMNQRWLWSGFIKAISRGGYTLYAYTVNNPEKAHRWAKYGLAGVVTDYPDHFMH